MGKKKNKIFSGRKYVPHGSFRRAEKKLLKGIFNTDNINTLTLEDIRDLKAYLKKQQKRIYDNGGYAGQIAREYNLFNYDFVDDPIELLEVYDKQMMYFSELEVDMEMNQHHEFDLMTKDDKWLIIRRLATEDLMLNLDRAYASETLKTIEELIEQHKGEMTYQELADALLNGEFEEYKFDRMHPEDGLMPFAKPSPFDIESQALQSNKGFHGVNKAMQKWRNQVGKSDLSGWAAVYQDPDLFSN